MNPGSARLPVSAISRSTPIVFSISTHSAPVRWSFHRIAGRRPGRLRPSRRGRASARESPMPAGGPALLAQLGERPLRRLPPVLGVLLGPAGPGRREGIRGLGPGDHGAVLAHGQRLHPRGADVDAERDGAHRAFADEGGRETTAISSFLDQAPRWRRWPGGRAAALGRPGPALSQSLAEHRVSANIPRREGVEVTDTAPFGRASPGGRRRPPAMADVGRLAGVSHQTVSRVINGNRHVRPETRRRVLAAMDELGYRPNSDGSGAGDGPVEHARGGELRHDAARPGVDAVRDRAGGARGRVLHHRREHEGARSARRSPMRSSGCGSRASTGSS